MDYTYPKPTKFQFGQVKFDGQKTTRIEEWPSWDLPVLKWGKEQGGVVGFSHSGWGLQVPGDHLPNFNMPRFDGIGANEYVVDVCHNVCDFISSVDTPIVWELAIWYHTLNCGYDCRISGETDFPCIYGDRVGLGRIYVKLPKNSKLSYQEWVKGLKDGRSYVGDGLSHLMDFQRERFRGGSERGPRPCQLSRGQIGREPEDHCQSSRVIGKNTRRKYSPPPARPKALLARRTSPNRQHA